MNKNFYAVTSGVIFFAAGTLHGLRAYFGWDLTIAGWMVPIWVSSLASLVAFLMALTAARMMK